jgi:hypothetical protein
MGTFFREWGRLLVAPLSHMSGVATMTRILSYVLPPSLFAGLFLTAWVWGTIPWWALPLSVLLVFYLSLTAGMALITARQPSVEIGPVELDEGKNKVFFVRLQNGDIPVTPTVQITRIRDADGNRIPGVSEQSWLAHWRNKPANHSQELSPGEEAEFGLLGASTTEQGNPVLFIWTTEHAHLPLSENVPLQAQRSFVIKVVVNYTDRTSTIGRRDFTFTVAPAPGSVASYRVEPEGGSSVRGWSYGTRRARRT